MPVVDTVVVVGGAVVVGGMVVVVVVVGATVVDVVVVDVLVAGLVDVVVLDVGVATTPVDCPDDASLPSSWRNDTTTVTQYAPGSANVIGSEAVALAPTRPADRRLTAARPGGPGRAGRRPSRAEHEGRARR